jgi:hypothetical protein
MVFWKFRKGVVVSLALALEALRRSVAHGHRDGNILLGSKSGNGKYVGSDVSLGIDDKLVESQGSCQALNISCKRHPYISASCGP